MKRVHGYCFTTTTQLVATVYLYRSGMTVRKITKQEVPRRTYSCFFQMFTARTIIPQTVTNYCTRVQVLAS